MMFLNPVTHFKSYIQTRTNLQLCIENKRIALTHHHTPCKITTHCKSSVGFSGSDYKGDNTPQLKAVFLCLPFFTKLNFQRSYSIMTALFWQPFRLVVPLYDTANQLNAVTRFLAVLRDGFILQNKGITA
jgi:hypothetical protein